MSKIIPDVAIAKNRLNDNTNQDQILSTERLAHQNGYLTNPAIGLKTDGVDIVEQQGVKVSNIIGNYSTVVCFQLVEHQ